MNLKSYLTSWWLYDLGHTIDIDAYARFMAWMDQSKIIKTTMARGWRQYRLDMFIEDMHELGELGVLIKFEDTPLLEHRHRSTVH
jgi:hypothetical protein